MRAFKLIFVVLLAGCATEPIPNVQLPEDEIVDVNVYKNIKNIRRFNDYVEAIVVDGKNIKYLHCWKYKIVIDADEPWWEETGKKVYLWKQINGRWVSGSQMQYYAVIHISKVEDIGH